MRRVQLIGDSDEDEAQSSWDVAPTPQCRRSDAPTMSVSTAESPSLRTLRTPDFGSKTLCRSSDSDDEQGARRSSSSGLELTGMGKYIYDMDLISPGWWEDEERYRVELGRWVQATPVSPVEGGARAALGAFRDLEVLESTAQSLEVTRDHSDHAFAVYSPQSEPSRFLESDELTCVDEIIRDPPSPTFSSPASSLSSLPYTPSSSSSFAPSEASLSPKMPLTPLRHRSTRAVSAQRATYTLPCDLPDLSPTPSLLYDTNCSSQGSSQSSAVLRTPSTPVSLHLPMPWSPPPTPSTPTKLANVRRPREEMPSRPMECDLFQMESDHSFRPRQLHHVSSDGGPVQALYRFLDARRSEPSLEGFSLFLHCPKKRVRSSKSGFTTRQRVVIEEWNALMSTIRTSSFSAHTF